MYIPTICLAWQGSEQDLLERVPQKPIKDKLSFYKNKIKLGGHYLLIKS